MPDKIPEIKEQVLKALSGTNFGAMLRDNWEIIKWMNNLDEDFYQVLNNCWDKTSDNIQQFVREWFATKKAQREVDLLKYKLVATFVVRICEARVGDALYLFMNVVIIFAAPGIIYLRYENSDKASEAYIKERLDFLASNIDVSTFSESIDEVL